ncbi:MAG: helix-turn-helix transcriptional regulator [Treponema sp.]|nr:helix-turn-helix transcriptional regulator [Treponema sp.]
MTEDEFRGIVRTNIKRYRVYKKWTQAEFAEKLDISVNFLSDVENGKRWISPASIVKFASILNIQPYELFKPFDEQPASVINLLEKYNDDIEKTISKSIKDVFIYYQSIIKSEIKKKTIHLKSGKNNSERKK